MQNHIGYFHVRSVDATRYDLYLLDNTHAYYTIDEKNYVVSLPTNLTYNMNNPLDITLSIVTNYNDFIDHLYLIKNKIKLQQPVGYYIDNTYVNEHIDFPKHYFNLTKM